MPQNKEPDLSAYYAFAPHPIDDRAYWQGVKDEPRFAGLLASVEQACVEASPEPPIACASDFLAARRLNDRSRLDERWRRDRRTLSALALRRCLLGLDPNDLDDRLLDWTWCFLTEATWAVSAHLPEKDLPASGKPTLDLASCEMAAQFAEMRECLKPWMDSVSGTLADSVVYEIDARILTPYGDGVDTWWDHQGKTSTNNWTGVCAGSILAACESLAVQGHPRPKARERALAALRMFLEKGFTPGGECDEGVGYWNYGVGMAALGWCRLGRDAFAAAVDLDRFRLVADYPRRAHLFENVFYSGNDAGLRAGAPQYFVPWLAAASGNRFLPVWADEFPGDGGWTFGQMMRALAAPGYTYFEDARASRTSSARLPATQTRVPPVMLDDQQAAIVREQTAKGELIVCFSGGHNAERHNHNDLGHFFVTLDKKIVVPDLGAPVYKSDFFGPNRYSYVTASSRGHCCPVIGDHEQRAGHEAAAKVLAWQPDGEILRYALDLTAAYPPEAGLALWTRTLERWLASGETPTRMAVIDVFKTKAPKQKITHVLWALESFREPDERVEGGGFRLRLGELNCEISPAPFAMSPTSFQPDDLLLRDFKDKTIYRIEAVYRSDDEGNLRIETRFFV
ncbi:MAG: heparinase II/III family protein [Planctomycetota bacterium]|nr:heparinase II/III family protein [Planctomycetota bacterium]